MDTSEQAHDASLSQMHENMHAQEAEAAGGSGEPRAPHGADSAALPEQGQTINTGSELPGEPEAWGVRGAVEDDDAAHAAEDTGWEMEEAEEEAEEEWQPKHTCVMCRAAPIEHLLLPCGHACICAGCWESEVCDGVYEDGRPVADEEDMACPVCTESIDVSAPGFGFVAIADEETWLAYGIRRPRFLEEPASAPPPASPTPRGSHNATPHAAWDGENEEATPHSEPRIDSDAHTVKADVQRKRTKGAVPLVDNDELWLSEFGPSQHEGMTEDGEWNIFYNLRRALPYYVHVATQQHTWKLPTGGTALHAHDTQPAEGSSASFPMQLAPRDSPTPVHASRKYEPRESPNNAEEDESGAHDEHGYEGLGSDFERNGPWVPPSLAIAREQQSKSLFARGTASLWRTGSTELAALGQGVPLYFRLQRLLVILLLIMAFASIPSMLVYYSGERMPVSYPDPLGFASVSLGNAGPISADAVALQKSIFITKNVSLLDLASSGASLATTGNVSASDAGMDTLSWWLSSLTYVSLLGTAVQGRDVLRILVLIDVSACALVFIVYLGFRLRIGTSMSESEMMKVSAADYSVLVRGLPPDAEEHELVRHFSALFALDHTGVGPAGASPVVQHARAAAAHSHKETSDNNDAAPVTTVIELPVHGHAVGDAALSMEEKAAAIPGPGAVATSDSIVSFGTVSMPPVVTRKVVAQKTVGKQTARRFNSTASVARNNKKETAAQARERRLALATLRQRLRSGVVSIADQHVYFRDRLNVIMDGMVHDVTHLTATHRNDQQHPEGGRGEDTGHTAISGRSALYLGTWVAHVSLLRRDIHEVSQYRKRQAVVQQLRLQRAIAKMTAANTPCPAGPNNGIRNKALMAASRLEFKLAKMMSKRAKNDSAARAAPDNEFSDLEEIAEAARLSECTGIAFITFNNEESAERALAAYHGSSFWLLRTCCQRRQLRFRHPAAPGFAHPVVPVTEAGRSVSHSRAFKHDAYSNFGRGYALEVERAPDPADVMFENLSYGFASRCCRLTLSTAATFVCLIIGMLAMVTSQTYSNTLAKQLPDAKLCNTELPALYFGSYEAVAAARQAVGAGYGGIVDDGSSIQGGANGAGLLPHVISSADGLPQLQFSRSSIAAMRAVEEQNCEFGDYSVTLRYDFTGVSESAWAQWPALPILPRFRNATLANKVQPSVPLSSEPHSRQHVGTSVAYGLPVVSCNTAGASAEVRARGASIASVPGDVTHAACPDPRRAPPNGSGYCQCVDPAGAHTCHTLPCFDPSLVSEPAGRVCRTFPLHAIASCFCLTSIESLESASMLALLINPQMTDASVCTPFVTAYVRARAMAFATSAVSSAVNIMLQVLLPLLVDFERHKSATSRSRALLVKLAAAQILNTFMTVVVVNARPPNGASVHPALRAIGLFDGTHDDFTSAWYATAGNAICTTLLINALLQPMLGVVGIVRARVRRFFAARRVGYARTQDEMNSIFVAPEFAVTARYSGMLTFLFGAFMFGAGMPMLYVLAALAICALFVLDRWMLLRFSSKPSGLGVDTALVTISAFPFALLLHVAVGIYMYTGGDIFPASFLSPSALRNFGLPLSSLGLSGSGSQSLVQAYDEMLERLSASDALGIVPRLIRQDTLPALLLLLFLLIILSVTFIVSTMWSVVTSVLRTVTCNYVCCKRGAKLQAQQEEIPVTVFSLRGKSLAVNKVMPLSSSRAPLTRALTQAAGSASQPAHSASTTSTMQSAMTSSTAPYSNAERAATALYEQRKQEAALTGEEVRLSTVGVRAMRSVHKRAWFLLRRLATVPRGIFLEGAALRWLHTHLKPEYPVTSFSRSASSRGLSPFTAEFSRVVDVRSRKALPPSAVQQGWILQAVHPDTMLDIHVASTQRLINTLATCANPCTWADVVDSLDIAISRDVQRAASAKKKSVLTRIWRKIRRPGGGTEGAARGVPPGTPKVPSSPPLPDAESGCTSPSSGVSPAPRRPPMLVHWDVTPKPSARMPSSTLDVKASTSRALDKRRSSPTTARVVEDSTTRTTTSEARVHLHPVESDSLQVTMAGTSALALPTASAGGGPLQAVTSQRAVSVKRLSLSMHPTAGDGAGTNAGGDEPASAGAGAGVDATATEQRGTQSPFVASPEHEVGSSSTRRQLFSNAHEVEESSAWAIRAARAELLRQSSTAILWPDEAQPAVQEEMKKLGGPIWILRKLRSASDAPPGEAAQHRRGSPTTAGDALNAAPEPGGTLWVGVKRTWEVIAENGIVSYDYKAHPRYHGAFKAVNLRIHSELRPNTQ